MGFRLVDPDLNIRAEFPYINSKAGISEDDGVALVFRPLTLDEIQDFDQRIGAAITYKANRKKGKGFRDRSKDERPEGTYTTDAEAMAQIKRDRIKTALIDWKGFEDDNGDSMPFSFDNFMKFCRTLPDLLNFADECVEQASESAIGKLRELKESEGNW